MTDRSHTKMQSTLIPVDPLLINNSDVLHRSDKKLKILFYHAGGWTGWLYTAALQFKTYIDLFNPQVAEYLEWLIPIQQTVSDSELIAHIEHTGADILCTSHYLWNHVLLTKQLANIKSRLKPDMKIIAGGPSIDVNNNEYFFEQHPYIDYAVYGAGEQAFADIISHLALKTPMIAFNTSNCAWKNHHSGKTVLADYKSVKMIETSPFVHNAKMFIRMVADVKKNNNIIWLPYSLTRGCPYACTFCDWNNGLENKVSRRKNTYQQEIDLFQKLKIKHIFLSDANVGQYDEDVDMIEYFAQKNLKENAGFHVGGNFSKLRKENNLKIFHLMAKGQLINKTLNFSIQDINKQVLENIDRPDVGWDVHVAMADELRTKYPHLIVKAQLIYGLPGQTIATWKHTLDQMVKQNIFPVIFLNEPLPTSPAMNDPAYQQKFEFEYVYSNRINVDNSRYFSKITKKSNSFSQHDLVQMSVLSEVYRALSLLNFALQEKNMPKLNISFIVDTFLQSTHYTSLCNNLYHNWTINNNFYYTINFSRQAENIADTSMGWMLVFNNSFLKYIMLFVLDKDRHKFLQFFGSTEFKKIQQDLQSDID